jgi:non-lysosomal glucosylceramidase
MSQVTPNRLPQADLPVVDPLDGCRGWNRRTFLKWTGLGAAALSAAPSGLTAVAGPFASSDVSDHFVPADKKLDAAWLAELSAKGASTWYQGSDLETIGMPVGGLCAGQLYLAGDGRLVHWDIFNQLIFTGYGRDSYNLDRQPETPLSQGFAIQASSGGSTVQRTLDIVGFPGLRFCGEYPIGTVEYRDQAFPVEVRLQAFSPFIPLNEEDSALPATVLQFTVKNPAQAPVDVLLAGWLENAVCLHSSQGLYGARRNRALRGDGLALVSGTAVRLDPPPTVREPIVLSDFEGDDYGDWQVEGEAFGNKPARGTLPGQQPVSGFLGQGLVNTYLGGDDRLHGKLTSPAFKIERDFLCFLIGGGNHAGRTCIHLLVDGRVVRTAAGKQAERLQWHNWDVRDLRDKSARIEIVDAESGPWGHINIDQIELRDQPLPAVEGELEAQPDFGSMALALLDTDACPAAAAENGTGSGARMSGACPIFGSLCMALPDGLPAETIFRAEWSADPPEAERPFGKPLVGAVAKRLTLEPGQEATVTFAVTWCFPTRELRGGQRGNHYANRFASAADVAGYLAEHADRLIGQTKQWHSTWYDSTLPHWLLDRLFSTASTLATSTCQWWANGRFWAWEGVGCCHGTCTHVWNYAHSMARLFPRLERSVREMQDYHPEAGFVEDTGMIRFRGEGWNMWAGDGQAGTILKAYREHLCSADGALLERNWPRIKKSLEFLIREDADENGLLEGSQHNTYDIDFFGPNTMVGSLYLAALQAGTAMADTMGDQDFATRCRRLFAAGSRLSVERLFNGEYFIQQVDLEKHPEHQYGDGCLADQLFGQGWAHQVGLGYVYPRAQVLAALQAIWRYNWAPDVGPQNEVHPPERWFARPGEAGLFTCTWPHSPHLARGVRYRDEVWTGIEYQVAGNMAWEGMVTEALAICRGVHERYHPAKHNPWNEVECGDHYARGLASHGVYLGLCGFEYDGPRGHLGFAPRMTPDDFRAAFTAAEGWGTLSQTRQAGVQTQCIEVRWGQLNLQTLAFEVPEGQQVGRVSLTCGTQTLEADNRQDARRLEIRLKKPLILRKGEPLTITIRGE